MLISHLTANHIGQTVSLQGWIAHLRSSGKIAFVNLRDGSGYLQCVVEQTTIGDDAFSALLDCGIESAVELT